MYDGPYVGTLLKKKKKKTFTTFLKIIDKKLPICWGWGYPNPSNYVKN